jgi:hypothetical protein
MSDWEQCEAAPDAADQTVTVGDRVVYTVGDRVARRLQFGVVEKIAKKGPFTHTYWPNGGYPDRETKVQYEYYEYKVWIRHSEPDNTGYWRRTGLSIIEGSNRFLALPEGTYEWVFEA